VRFAAVFWKLGTAFVVQAIVLATPAFTQTPADQIWSELASGSRRFVLGKSEPRDLLARRKELAKAQHPRVALLSCVDSRVPPELIFNEGLGGLFVVHSTGENADRLAVGSFVYAIEHLGTVVIVVMGHQSCGAVKAPYSLSGNWAWWFSSAFSADCSGIIDSGKIQLRYPSKPQPPCVSTSLHANGSSGIHPALHHCCP
jgi:Carbonic anhydrase